MAAILTPRVVRRIAGECTDLDERGAVGIRLEPAAAIDENQDGTRGSNLLCSATESVSAGSRGRWRPKSRLWRRLCLVRDVRKGRAGYDQTLFGPVSLTGIDAVPVQESSTRSQRRGGRGEGRGLRHTSWLCGSACEQFALLGPVQR